MQRLFPGAVAREKQRLVEAVPNRKREHAAQAAQHVRAVFFVAVQNRLRVGMRFERMPRLFERLPEFLKIVNFAVEDDVQRPVLVLNRLMPAGEVNNAQAAHG